MALTAPAWSVEARAALAGAAAGVAVVAAAAAAAAAAGARARARAACCEAGAAPGLAAQQRQRRQQRRQQGDGHESGTSDDAHHTPPPRGTRPAAPGSGYVGVGTDRERISPARLTLPPSPVTAKVDPLSPFKRTSYLSWDDYFMSIAFLSARRSKDPNKQVGACIVGSDNVIVGIGYNGFPRGCADEQLPWAKIAQDGDPLKTKYPYVCHAEVNAILNANSVGVRGSSVYVTMYPCNECAKVMIQAGVAEVVFFEAKGGNKAKDARIYEASKRLLALSGVRTRQHCPDEPITLDFARRQPCVPLAEAAAEGA